MTEIRENVRRRRTEEVQTSLDELISELSNEGFSVEFGTIGTKTTYAMIYTEDHELEYVGYTFIRNMKYYNENTGKLKALNQAIARKETLVLEA